MRHLIDEFNNMKSLPLFELELTNDEYLLVHLSIDEKGIYFKFDEEYPVYFDGEIIRVNTGTYLMPFDEYEQSLDYYLQAISNNLNDGYILPNNLARYEL